MKFRSLAAVFGLCLGMAAPAFAQSFFSTLVIDPVVGVDRGSASLLRKVDDPTGFFVFSNTGSTAVGRTVLGLGYSAPNLLTPDDQLDLSAAWAGPSDQGFTELRAFGFGYRYPVLGDGSTVYVNADYGDVTPGSPRALALGLVGDRLQVATGLRRIRDLGQTAKLTQDISLISRSVRSSTAFGPFIDEDLRMIRASLLYSKGIPFLFQKRASFSVTKGLSGLGASARNNPLSSIPGAESDFFRASFALEMSLPLSRKWVTNAGLIGQWSDDILPASQRCGFGTNAYARGFDYSLVSADRCLGTRVEIAYNIELPDPRAERLQFTQGYLGIDAGIIQNVTNGASNPKDNWSSLSLGLRSLRGNSLGEISVTRILDAPAVAVAQNDSRLWIRGAVRF